MSADVHAYADQLRQYATHFEMRDWDYTRDLGDLVAIRHNGQHDALRFRLRMALRALFRLKRDRVFRVGRWRMFRTHLRRDSHLPDGILDGGAIITHWEETGEYLQYVQPSVGALLADLMDARPDLPEVQAIADEMKRINDRYAERIESEES
jgi:hypothetical protein